MSTLIKEGSVKNIMQGSSDESLVFEYTDNYSVFDWGRMPDEIEKKGECLTIMAETFFDYFGRAENWNNWQLPDTLREYETVFKKLQQKGLKNHFIKKTGTKSIEVQRVNVVEPKAIESFGVLRWDYSAYQLNPIKTIIPLEVIFRHKIVEGSSLLKRRDNAEYCASLGVRGDEINPNQEFKTPLIETSSKLETKDRYMVNKEAQSISGLSDNEYFEMIGITKIMALRLKEMFGKMGIDLIDGKFEFAYGERVDGQREIMMIDSIGPDELRLVYKGIQLSKEALRKYYKGSLWEKDLALAKKEASKQGKSDWKSFCKYTPDNLSTDKISGISTMYKTLTDQLLESVGRPLAFNEHVSLDDLYGGLV